MPAIPEVIPGTLPLTDEELAMIGPPGADEDFSDDEEYPDGFSRDCTDWDMPWWLA